MRLAFQGFDKAGKPTSGTIEVAARSEATEQLRRQGIFVTRVDDARSAGTSGRRRGGAGRLKNLATFTRQLSILVSTHTPLVQALEAVGRQTPPSRWRDVIEDVRRRVEEGASLSDAMASHPKDFDAVCRSLIAAGESGGRLGDLLERLAAVLRGQLHVQRAVLGAMVYPAVLIVVSIGVLVVMMAFVLPRFEGLFQTLNAPLPPTTEAIMALSWVLKTYWWAFLGGLLASGFLARSWALSPKGRLALHRWAVRAPKIGAITRSFATARIARVLGVLLEGKVGMLEAIRLTREATANQLYTELLTRAGEAVGRGETLTSAFCDTSLISPSVCEAVASGERTGRVGEVLNQVADFLDEDNEVLVKALTSIIEPIILVFLGLAVGFVAISLFLPLFDLTSTGGGA
jgi:type II secretory pathway component PulF